MKSLLSIMLCIGVTFAGYSQRLYKLVEKGDFERVEKEIDKGTDVNEYTKRGLFALWRASANNDIKMVELLLDYDADPNQITLVDPNYSAAIDYPAQEGYIDIVKLLYTYGSYIDAEGYERVTPLQRASSNGQLTVVTYLIEKGVEINHADTEGNFALGEAARNGFLNVVKWLVNNGADLNQRNNYSKTAYDIALANGHMNVAEFLQTFEIPANAPPARSKF